MVKFHSVSLLFNMPATNSYDYLKDRIASHIQQPVKSFETESVAGGSINKATKVTINEKHIFFLKENDAIAFPLLFEKEKNGLRFLEKTNTIETAKVIACDTIEDKQFLLLEWIASAPKSGEFWKNFGEKLAALHYTSGRVGFYEDNYMGALAQVNGFSETWIDFFIQKRLQVQVRLAMQQKLLTQFHVSLFEKLYQKLDTIFPGENASLLHGDLWSGNFICNKNQQPVLIDPAVYYGHHSMDLGMTSLFGGFDNKFYEAYNYQYPLPNNYKEQWQVCNLYPLLIHLNLFGISYLQDIELFLKKFTG